MMWQALAFMGAILFSGAGCDAILGTLPEGQVRDDLRGIFVGLHIFVLFAGSVIIGATL